MTFIFLLSGLFLGWSLGANDMANIFGSAVETRMLRFKRAALIAAFFVTLGAMLQGSGPSQTLSRLGSVSALGGAFTVALAAAIAITVMVRTGISVSTSQAIVGAIIGWNYFAGKVTDYTFLARVAGSWIVAPIISAVLAAILYYLFRYYINKTKMHLLELDHWTRNGLVAIGAFGAYSLGANNIANVVGVFVTVSPFKDVLIPHVGVLTGNVQLYLMGALAIVAGIYTYSHKNISTVGKDLFRLNPFTALISLMAAACVLFMFSSKGLHVLFVKLGIPTLPLVAVSSSQVMVGAVLGIGLVKGGKNLNYSLLGRIGLGWILTPLIAFLVSYVALFIVQNVFETTVKEKSQYIFDASTLTQMDKTGIHIGRLANVNGRTYGSEQEAYNILDKDGKLPRYEIIRILRIAEYTPIKVDVVKLAKHRYSNQISWEQLIAIRALNGRKYAHNWQFANDLQRFAAWELTPNPSTTQEKERNKSLEAKLDLLYQLFELK